MTAVPLLKQRALGSLGVNCAQRVPADLSPVSVVTGLCSTAFCELQESRFSRARWQNLPSACLKAINLLIGINEAATSVENAQDVAVACERCDRWPKAGVKGRSWETRASLLCVDAGCTGTAAAVVGLLKDSQ